MGSGKDLRPSPLSGDDDENRSSMTEMESKKVKYHRLVFERGRPIRNGCQSFCTREVKIFTPAKKTERGVCTIIIKT